MRTNISFLYSFTENSLQATPPHIHRFIFHLLFCWTSMSTLNTLPYMLSSLASISVTVAISPKDNRTLATSDIRDLLIAWARQGFGYIPSVPKYQTLYCHTSNECWVLALFQRMMIFLELVCYLSQHKYQMAVNFAVRVASVHECLYVTGPHVLQFPDQSVDFIYQQILILFMEIGKVLTLLRI